MPSTESRSLLAQLYFDSNSVQFGAFRISAHETDPTLPLTPLYLHYPKDSAPGSELLPQMFQIIGELFCEIIQTNNIAFDKIAGIPAGADPFAKTTAEHFRQPIEVLLNFDKKVGKNERRYFSGPIKGLLEKGDTVLVLDDHTSGGYNKSLFIELIESMDANVTDVLTVVDREQGASDFLRSRGVKLHSIFTISELLHIYRSNGSISNQQYDQVTEYVQHNQIKL